MKAAEIRTRFLEYFEKNGHTQVHSSPLVPKDDPSLLFTNAGMVQFKKTFLGQEKRDYKRATTSQKCLRVGGKHNDLENVGRTARHHTFFEMLGNFSFGDYFKEDAIRFCWQFLTEEMGLPKDKLYITIYKDDDEAGKLWQKVAGVAPERIFRLGDKDNFWSMGDTGPCGPCSEVHIDQGEEMRCGPDCGIGKCDCDRFLEIWNLVFMQYDQAEDGTRTNLPRPSIDTGMGLERIAAVCQGVKSNYESDLFTPIIKFTADLAGVTYKTDVETDTALQVIADHSRAIAFLIPDQVLPSNEGRGYVLRRLIRRAYRFGRLMGIKEAFLYKTAGKVVDDMGHAFPELLKHRPFMEKVVREEEERFSQTLDKGLGILEEEIAAVKAAGSSIISGETAFKLYDTFGFPIDIVNDVAEKQGLTVDEPAYNACMQEQKTRAKKAWKGSGEKDASALFGSLLEKSVSSKFTGYDQLEEETRAKALLDEKGARVEKLSAGENGWLVTVDTPFYGESGGQVGDAGRAESLTGKAEVMDTLKPSPELTVLKITVVEGFIEDRKDIRLHVNKDTRLGTARNHTATHLLHAALRKVLGDHVNQSGSLVAPDRLRFDFTHIAAMTPEEIRRVEDEVNRAVLANEKVLTEVMSNEDAVKKGATALFGEKYGDEVRVVQVPGVSMELCGGTHLSYTGQTGPFVILSESGIAAGIRRIEAATGWNALNQLQDERSQYRQAAAMLKASAGQVPEKIQALQAEVKAMQKEMERLQAKLASGAGRDLLGEAEEVNGVKVLAVEVEAPNPKVMREQVDALRTKLESGVIALAAKQDGGKAALIVAVSKDLLGRFKAGDLIKQAAAEIGGSGGGRPDMAQAGGTSPEGIPAALAKIKGIVAAG
ncbi:MAG: alanine--tRNA ligase [Desulfovibrionaceae bacterium]